MNIASVMESLRRLPDFLSVNGKRIPRGEQNPNKETLEAMQELESGGGKTFNTVDELFEDLEK